MSGARDREAATIPLLKQREESAKYASLEVKAQERTAHYFDLDQTITKEKKQYEEKDRDIALIAENIKPNFLTTFRNLLAKDAVIAIVTRGNEYRVRDVLVCSGLTQEEIAKIGIYAENKDDGSSCDDNYKKRIVADLIENNTSIKHHYYYDDSAQECMEIDALAKDFPHVAIVTYQVSRDPIENGHFGFALAISSNPNLRMKIDDSSHLTTRNDAVSGVNSTDFRRILRSYASTSCLSSCCLFNPDRSKAIRGLRELSTLDFIRKDEIKAAISSDSKRRLTLFTDGEKIQVNGSSTDDVILQLSTLCKA